jgi:Retron-type reverse transcriptase
MKGVTAMNVKHSTMPQGKRLTDMQLKDQWEQFDWKLAEKHINGLQTRITKATLKKDWNLVKRLQYLLVNSFSGKMLAVKKVASNKGKKTAGIDGEIWLDSTSKMLAVLNLTVGKVQGQTSQKNVHRKTW